MSGVHGFGFYLDLKKVPEEKFIMQLVLPCSPENTGTLVNTAVNEIRKIQEEGITREDLKKEIEAQRGANETNAKKNNVWLNKMVRIYKMNEDMTSLTNPDAYTNMVTSDELQRVAQEYLELKNYIRVTLYPEKKQENND